MIAASPKKIIIYSTFLLIYLAMPSFSFAGLPLRNVQIFSQYIGVPELKNAQKLQDGEQDLAVNFILSNQFSNFSREVDPLFVDTESYVSEWVWRRGWQGVEWEVTVPLLTYQDGFMDQSIVSFHRLLSFPNGNRSTRSKNHIDIEYDGRDKIIMNHNTEGLGDVRVQAGWQLLQSSQQDHAIHISLKLPTGNDNDLLGSGGTDVALFATHDWQYDRWSWQWQWGAIALGSSSLWEKQMRHLAGFTTVALERRISGVSSIVVQYDAHTPYYKGSSQVVLGDGHMLSVGYVRRMGRWLWYAAMMEDIVVNTAPDISFQWGFSYYSRSK